MADETKSVTDYDPAAIKVPVAPDVKEYDPHKPVTIHDVAEVPLYHTRETAKIQDSRQKEACKDVSQDETDGKYLPSAAGIDPDKQPDSNPNE